MTECEESRISLREITFVTRICERQCPMPKRLKENPGTQPIRIWETSSDGAKPRFKFIRVGQSVKIGAHPWLTF